MSVAAVAPSDRLELLDRLGPVAGLVGSGAIALGSLVAGVAYRGRLGEPYSPLHHFVSELGELGVSALAPLFNLGVIAGGIGFVVFMVTFGIRRGGLLGLLAGAVGAVAGTSGALVGVFPMNEIGRHALAALGFFWLGGVAIALASLAIVVRRDPRFPRWLTLPGVLTVVLFAAFLRVLYSPETTVARTLAAGGPRPEVWLLTILEWAEVVALLGWVALASATWLRAGAAAPSPAEAVA